MEKMVQAPSYMKEKMEGAPAYMKEKMESAPAYMKEKMGETPALLKEKVEETPAYLMEMAKSLTWRQRRHVRVIRRVREKYNGDRWNRVKRVLSREEMGK